MMQKPLFKVFIWIMSSSFFFIISSMLIGYWSPVSESQVMMFMSGMMNAMENSLMGFSMSLEGDSQIMRIINIASLSLLPLILISILFGIYFRFRRKMNAKRK